MNGTAAAREKAPIPLLERGLFYPFFERAADRLSSGLGKPMICAMLPTVAFCAVWLVKGGEILQDWSWLLPILIGIAASSVYYATATLHKLIFEMGRWAEADQSPRFAHILRDRIFIAWGAFFAFANTTMGLIFGIPGGRAAHVVFVAEFALVGFICGLAVCGIYGVVSVVDGFAPLIKSQLDYRAPDGCGGTHSLGAAFVQFSSVTMTTGIMIALYVGFTRWTNLDLIVKVLRWGWIVFPFVWAIGVFAFPGWAISKVANEYKAEQDQTLRKLISEHKHNSHNPLPGKREAERKEYEYAIKERSALYKMHSWPFSLGSSIHFAVVLLLNGAAAGKDALEILHGTAAKS